LTVTNADEENFFIMFEDINSAGKFVKSGLIKAGGSAANVTAAIAPYYNSATGTDPTTTRLCYDDLEQEKPCDVRIRYDHTCPDTPYTYCETCRASVGGPDIDCLDASATVCVVPEAPISESTTVGGASWFNLKIGAMNGGYGNTPAFVALSNDDKTLVT
jgi:hypothetical protein